MRRIRRVVLVMPTHGNFRDVILGFNTIAASRHWNLSMLSSPGSAASIAVPAEIDAWILGGDGWDWVPRRFWNRSIAIGADLELSGYGHPSVLVDDPGIGRAAAKHLLERGFRTFGAFGLVEHEWSRRRAQGFREAVEECGGQYVEGGDCFTPKETAHLDAWVASLPKPAGVFASCDRWAHLLACVCERQGVRVPEEVSIVGVDNDPLLCEVAHPPLSSVIAPWHELGVEIALLLDRVFEGERVPPEPTRIPPLGVASRQSTDTAAISDPDVASALAFVRRNADRPLGVPDILKQVPTYRHKLERGFRRLLGRTIMDEVRRAHVGRAKHLLATTDLPAYQVAQRSGFTSPAALSVAFRRETGMTPSDYRRRFRQEAGRSIRPARSKSIRQASAPAG